MVWNTIENIIDFNILFIFNIWYIFNNNINIMLSKFKYLRTSLFRNKYYCAHLWKGEANDYPIKLSKYY